MDNYRLNRGIDGLSAGTVVTIVDASADEPHKVTVTPVWVLDDEYYETEFENLTPCRVMTDIIATPTREQRRADKPRKQDAENATDGSPESIAADS